MTDYKSKDFKVSSSLKICAIIFLKTLLCNFYGIKKNIPRRVIELHFKVFGTISKKCVIIYKQELLIDS